MSVQSSRNQGTELSSSTKIAQLSVVILLTPLYPKKVLWCFQHFVFDVLLLLLAAGDVILLLVFDIENVLVI